MSFRLTYATMFNPPEELHERFEKRARHHARRGSGRRTRCSSTARTMPAAATDERMSPIDSQILIGRFPHANAKEVDAAIAAAERAAAGVARCRHGHARCAHAQGRAPAEERVYDIAAALTLEVGKNRLEALGEAQETVDFFRCLRRRLRVAQGLRVRAAERPFERLRLAQPERDASLRRLGRDRAVQFPDCARGRA